MSHSSNSLKNLLVGLAIGSIVGILFAPARGKKTRNKIRRFKEDLSEDLKLKLHHGIECLKDKFELSASEAAKFLEIEKAINNKISRMTLKIQEDCPEIYKYIDEMPDTLFKHTDPEITLRNLNNYHDSLVQMYENFLHEKK